VRYAEFVERTRFDKAELLGLAEGTLVDDPPAEFVRLPAPPMLMLDRVTEIAREGPRGRIVGEKDVRLDDWWFGCHFRGDPVQPGCLGVDAIWQLLGLYIAAAGCPGSGRALGCKEVEFAGQIRPHDRLVTYALAVTRLARLKDSGAAVALADATVSVDGEVIYTVRAAKVGMFLGIRYADYPRPSTNARGGLMDRGGQS
jgi:3-hydroxyacyl-[acyl-carrier protein] dehydratase/trans-2-decenoyl-[acyl-carrier protein] isomerase